MIKLSVQQRMWDAIRDPRYVSDPAVNAGRHTRGTAVDVTLVDRRGKELPMPTDFDDFSAAAHVDAPGISNVRASNARRLCKAMERHGFRAFPTEWWHFDWKDWQDLPVVRANQSSPIPDHSQTRTNQDSKKGVFPQKRRSWAGCLENFSASGKSPFQALLS